MTRSDLSIVKLRPEQRVRLVELVRIVKENLHAVSVMMAAIYEIKHDSLWMETHTTFGDYCVDVLGITKRKAGQWLSVQKTLVAIPAPMLEQTMPDGSPLRLAHVVTLQRCADGKQVEVLARAVEIAEGHPRMTSKIIEQAAIEVRLDNAPDKPDLIDEIELGLPLFASAVRAAAGLINEIKVLGRMASGKRLRVDRLESVIEQVIADIRHAKPHSTCVACGGAPGDREECHECGGAGVSTKTIYRLSSDEQRKRARVLGARPQSA